MEQVIEARLGVAEPVIAAPEPVLGKVGDLMEALRASIEATKAVSTEPEPEEAPAEEAASTAGS